MNAKIFFKTFKWGRIFSALPVIAAGIAALSVPTERSQTVAIAEGVLLALSGVTGFAGYFSGNDDNVLRLLAYAVQAAVAVWLLVSLGTSYPVLGIGLGAVALLFAAGGVHDAVLARKTERLWIVKIAVCALLAGLAIVVMVDPFDGARDLMITAGVLLLAVGLGEIAAVARAGFFRRTTSEDEKKKVRGVRELRDSGAEPVRNGKKKD